jgi:tetratricopeptide (TPR) repeat protein
MTVTRLQALDVSAQAQAAKLFWVAELARVWNREPLVRSSLEQSCAQVPPFAPAYRVLLGLYWTRDDWDVNRKREASQKLISSVERQGDQILALELRGMVFLNDRDPARACDQFAKAQELGGDATDLRLAYAAALKARGDVDRAEQVYWKLANDQPTCEDAYLNLFHNYLANKKVDPAMNALKTWLANDPGSINAYILESVVFVQMNEPAAAERTLNDLFEREPDSSDVLVAMANFYKQTGRTDEFIKKLEAQTVQHPENRLAVEQLVMLYAEQKRLPDATRVLDAARASAGNDVDSLYHIGALYTRIGQKETTEQVLQQIVQIDPHHAPASNDLGYGWAEQGKNLVRAEALVRVAVQNEPDNSSFLDSLGWVLYKRGQFTKAREQLELAVNDASFPDPVVLDHLGDTLYRLDKKSEATAQWKRAQERMGKTGGDDDRDDLKQLRLQLQQKIKQAESGQPVGVSPVADEPPRQAKNEKN